MHYFDHSVRVVPQIWHIMYTPVQFGSPANRHCTCNIPIQACSPSFNSIEKLASPEVSTSPRDNDNLEKLSLEIQ